MAQRGYSNQRSGPGSTLAVVGIVLIGLVGGALLLHSTGAINLPFLASDEGPPPPDHTGKVAVVTCIRPIRAYSRVEAQHILNPKTGRIQYSWLRPEEIPEGAAREPREVLGRVIRWDKPFGKIFMMTDFYPEGTRPGLTAGIPQGKRAMRLAATDVPGLHGLRQGDHFDLVMTVEVEVEEPTHRNRRRHEKLEIEGPWAPLHEAASAEAAETPYIVRRRAEVRVIVRDGVVVQPVTARTEITKQTSLFENKLKAVPVEELVIAIRPEEVSALNQAMTLDANLQVAMRSGQPEDLEVDSTPMCEIPDIAIDIHELRPELDEAEREGTGKIRLIEVIEGGEKQIIAIPAEKVVEKDE